MNLVKAFEGHDLRFVSHPDGLFEFGIVATDLATLFESDLNGHRFSRSVDEEWKGVHEVFTPNGGTQKMVVIWEPGVYQLACVSRLPKSKPFRHWLFTEVLPSIRQTGSYSVTQDSSASDIVSTDSIHNIERQVEELRYESLESTNHLDNRLRLIEDTLSRHLDSINLVVSRLANGQIQLGRQANTYPSDFDPFAASKKEWLSFCEENGFVRHRTPKLPALHLAKKLGYVVNKEDYARFERFVEANTHGMGTPKQIVTNDGYSLTVNEYPDVPVVHDVIRQFFC